MAIYRFGHPRLARLPNTVGLARVQQLLEGVAASVGGQVGKPELLITSDTGDSCSRCPAVPHCRGCPLPALADAAGELVLKPADCLTLRWAGLEKNAVEEAGQAVQHSSMTGERLKLELDLQVGSAAVKLSVIPGHAGLSGRLLVL